MPTVGKLIERLMPRGSHERPDDGNAPPDWRSAPIWPPDVFAIAATLVRHSECYALAAVRGGLGLGKDHPGEMQEVGNLWARDLESPRLLAWLRMEWEQLLAGWEKSAGDEVDADGEATAWAVAALRLMAAADEACAGVGFGGDTLVARTAEVIAFENDGQSLCWLVDPSEACVQPKARTPPVGCTLRSLSLHLALLPSIDTVTTVHIDADPPTPGKNSFGVLLVPFPYELADSDVAHREVKNQRWGNLSLGCGWTRAPRPKALALFVKELVTEARRKGRTTDIVVLPELAMSRGQFMAVWNSLRPAGVQLLVSGVHVRERGVDRNLVVGLLRGPKRGADIGWEQSKHHRWRIEKLQIQNYGLKLPADKSWWEDIDISERAVVTARFADGASVACLVCEDLARIEPVQPVLREMGPSLLIALLMDGPQLSNRWAARASGTFADDPGSSVLVLTSLALVRRNQVHRSKHAGAASPPIGVWQEPEESPIEIPIGPDAHAVHFTLNNQERREVTLDGRDDRSAAEVLRLDRTGSSPFLQISHRTPPRWARPIYSSTG